MATRHRRREVLTTRAHPTHKPGVADVLICRRDGLTGLPEAVVTVWPDAIARTRVVHLIGDSMKFVSHTDREAVATDLVVVE